MNEPGENFSDYKAGDEQRQNYGKQGAHHMNRDDKTESSGKGTAVHAGGGSGQNNGPTGSKRDYGKKGRESSGTPNTNWTPMSGKPSTYGLGCDC